MKEDTVKLLKECDSGIKMGVSVIDGVIDEVRNCDFKRILEDSKSEHEHLRKDIEIYLNSMKEEGMEPTLMAKSMSWMDTNMKLLVDDRDTRIAEIVTDGCNMGVKSLCQYLNQYYYATEMAKDLTNKLIGIEEKLAKDIRNYL